MPGTCESGHHTPPGHQGDPGNPTWFHPDAPKIISGFQSSKKVTPGEVIAFQIAAMDPHDLPLTYTWLATQGNVSAHISQVGNEAVWTAPFIDTTVVVTVWVVNTSGLPATKSFHIRVHADLGTAVFVSPDGSNSNSGSSADPYATIQQAIDAAAANGQTDVVLAAGTYMEGLQLPSHINLWGSTIRLPGITCRRARRPWLRLPTWALPSPIR